MDKNNNIIYAAILGAGTVGGGVYKLSQSLKDDIRNKTGAELVIKKILVRNVSKERPGMDKSLFTDDFETIVNDKDIDIVIELMGGTEPAKTYVIEALKAGKQVVTANKDLLAEHGKEVMDAASEAGADLQFEAAVAGAIPIIRPLKQSMAGNRINEIMGIVNGTTNYILTKMTEEGMGYKEALAKATELGYAEADPTADVEGYDAGRKVAIMASIAFNSRVTFSDVYTEGITKITAEDIRYAKEFGYVIKLLGVAKNTEQGIEVKVHPMLIDANHPLATVRNSFNAVFVHGDAMDDAMFMGRGAGQMPTASAVMGDVIDVMRNLVYNCCGRIGCSCYNNINIKKIDETKSKFFLRIQATDKSGVLANIASVLGNNDVSIAQVVQKSRKEGIAELVIITDEVEEKNFNDAMAVFAGMSVVQEISGVIRVN
ncbi:MAG: homoserine dehydrogenase [Eubacteriales bacterium]|nr:homoserine dehydrogenase [Eubacteriales bacterium]